MSGRWLSGGVAAVLVLAATGARSQPATAETTITAEQLTYDYKRSMAVFEQNVVVVDPQVRIESELLNVFFDQSNDVKSVTAVGNVRVRSEDRTATCTKAVYMARSGEIILTGDARLMRGKDTLSGDQITFWIAEERVVCKPGRLTIYGKGDRGGGKTVAERLLAPPGGKTGP